MVFFIIQGVSRKVEKVMHTISRSILGLQAPFWALFEGEGWQFMKIKGKLEKLKYYFMQELLEIGRFFYHFSQDFENMCPHHHKMQIKLGSNDRNNVFDHQEVLKSISLLSTRQSFKRDFFYLQKNCQFFIGWKLRCNFKST